MYVLFAIALSFGEAFLFQILYIDIFHLDTYNLYKYYKTGATWS